MAQFGAKRPVFAPIKTTPDGALPTYDYEKKVTIGKLVKADLTVTNASGELYGDDALAEKVVYTVELCLYLRPSFYSTKLCFIRSCSQHLIRYSLKS